MCLLLRIWFLNILFLGLFLTMLNMILLEWKCEREDIVNKNDLMLIVHNNVIVIFIKRLKNLAHGVGERYEALSHRRLSLI